MISKAQAEAICVRKAKFYTRKEAKGVIRKFRRKHGIKLQIFSCSICGYFHLTKQRLPHDARRPLKAGKRRP